MMMVMMTILMMLPMKNTTMFHDGDNSDNGDIMGDGDDGANDVDEGGGHGDNDVDEGDDVQVPQRPDDQL